MLIENSIESFLGATADLATLMYAQFLEMDHATTTLQTFDGEMDES